MLDIENSEAGSYGELAPDGKDSWFYEGRSTHMAD
jgi:hypothetical protein